MKTRNLDARSNFLIVKALATCIALNDRLNPTDRAPSDIEDMRQMLNISEEGAAAYREWLVETLTAEKTADPEPLVGVKMADIELVLAEMRLDRAGLPVKQATA